MYIYIGCDFEYVKVLYNKHVRFFNTCFIIVTSNTNIQKYFQGFKKTKVILDPYFRLSFLDKITEELDKEFLLTIKWFEVDDILLQRNMLTLLDQLYLYMNGPFIYKYKDYNEYYILHLKEDIIKFCDTHSDHEVDINSNNEKIEIIFY
jgi:hypothetical protein